MSSKIARIPAALPGQMLLFGSAGKDVIIPEDSLTLRCPQVLRWFSGEEAYPREWRGKFVRTNHTFPSGDKVMRAYLLGKSRGWVDVQWFPDPPKLVVDVVAEEVAS